MKFRLKAFALHVLSSAAVLTLILGTLYFGWYRWPGWYLTGVLHVLVILILADLLLGPTLTFVIANPFKARRTLARDIAVIAAVQIAALAYGAVTLWHGRPLYYVYSVDSLDMVQASDIEAGDVRLARQRNPALAPYWYSLPRWVWAPLPRDPEEAAKIVSSAVLGGKDVIDMPQYFRPWEQGLTELRKQLSPVPNNRHLSKSEQNALAARIRALGLAPEVNNTLIMWGGTRRVLAVFDPQTLEVKNLLAPP